MYDTRARVLFDGGNICIIQEPGYSLMEAKRLDTREELSQCMNPKEG